MTLSDSDKCPIVYKNNINVVDRCSHVHNTLIDNLNNTISKVKLIRKFPYTAFQ